MCKRALYVVIFVIVSYSNYINICKKCNINRRRYKIVKMLKFISWNYKNGQWKNFHFNTWNFIIFLVLLTVYPYTIIQIHLFKFSITLMSQFFKIWTKNTIYFNKIGQEKWAIDYNTHSRSLTIKCETLYRCTDILMRYKFYTHCC